jgi:endonuclease YncB( thermonuclease family)
MGGVTRSALLAGLLAFTACGSGPTSRAQSVTEAAQPERLPLRRVVSAYDGDTLKTLEDGSVRLVGYDTPERQGSKCPLERRLALEARDVLLELTKDGVALARARDKKGRLEPNEDRYGRLLRAGTLPDRRDLATAMLEARSRDGLPLAVEYWGERRTHDWCKVGARR